MIGYRIHKPAREPDSKKKDEIEVPDPLNKEDLICYNEIVNEDKQMKLIIWEYFFQYFSVTS